MEARFKVDHWAAWAAGLPDASAWQAWLAAPHELPAGGERPALSLMPAAQRRRLEGVGRIALQAAYDCQGDTPEIPAVFCSRYGELSRAVQLLLSVAAREPLSPATFSVSVHNAVGALYSIARGQRGAATSVAAGRETVEAGFVEALGLLGDGAARVMVVCYEEPVPAVYGEHERTFPHAWSCLLSAANGGGIALTSSAERSGAASAQHGLPWSLEILRFLVGDVPMLEHQTGERTWRWRRAGQNDGRHDHD